jgi:predicted Zn-dependent peptidase
MELKYHKSKLKNGMRLITVSMKNTDAVTAIVLVGVGSHYENKRLSGVSHYLEHLVFKGSKKYPSALKISTRLDSLGAEFNAFTSYELTGFYIKAVADKIEVGLDVMADYLKNPLFKSSEVKREKGVILEEIRMYLDNPQTHVDKLFTRALYGDQPAGRSVAGTEESVMGIGRADIKRYFEKHYVSSNIIVVFAGNIAPARGKNLADKFFKNLRKGENLAKIPVKLPSAGARIASQYKKSDQTHLAIGFSGVSMDDERRYAANLLAVILGGGMSSRLFVQVRERRGLAYYVRSGSYEGTDHGYFVNKAGVANDKFAEASRVIIKELRKTKKELVTRSELEKAKNRIEGLTLLELENSYEVGASFGIEELLLNKIVGPNEYLRKIKAVRADDIRNVANDIFIKKNARLAFVGPHKDIKKLEKIINTI